MIEAVNSVLANAQVLRGNAEQASTAATAAIELKSVEAVNVPKAPYISPYISVDLDTNKAVIQIRDADTGDVVRQFPTERSLQLRRAEVVARQDASEARSTGQNVPTPTPVAVPQVGVSDSGQVSDVAQAQVASTALATGAQTAAQTQSAGVSVLA